MTGQLMTGPPECTATEDLDSLVINLTVLLYCDYMKNGDPEHF